jgi:hypothetical protein
MATASIPMPGMTLRLKIAKPHGYRIRMAVVTWLLWLAGRVAPSNIDVQTEITLAE